MPLNGRWDLIRRLKVKNSNTNSDTGLFINVTPPAPRQENSTSHICPNLLTDTDTDTNSQCSLVGLPDEGSSILGSCAVSTGKQLPTFRSHYDPSKCR